MTHLGRQSAAARDLVAGAPAQREVAVGSAPRIRGMAPRPEGQPPGGENTMNVEGEVLRVLDEVLSLGGRGVRFNRDTRLLGALPELDSMAVVSVITALEERVGISVDDGEIDSSTFATVGSLVDFVERRAGGR